MLPPYSQWLAHSYQLDVRFLGTTCEVISTPSFGRAVTPAFRPVGWRLQQERLDRCRHCT